VAAVDPLEHEWFEGSGEPSDFASIASAISDTDLLAFGELHQHPVGSRYQLELLTLLAEGDRPLALAMEFFEADHQGALDAYLSGDMSEDEFRESTSRNEAYDSSHRPLVELCKKRGIPIVAANAPRRLVTAYRKSGLEYGAYLESLSDQEREWMPASSAPPEDEHKRRFMEAMRGMDHGEDLFKSMALWNDAMAASIAEFKSGHPDHLVVLVVGVFHVQRHLGTVTAYLERRPEDRVQVLSMMQIEQGELVFGDDHRDEGDAILLVRPQP
jgi:uncharacterized iron-regulated protein